MTQHDLSRQFFDVLMEKVAAHPAYSVALRKAAAEQEQLFLDYHNHAPGEPYCASINVRLREFAMLGDTAPLNELAHISGFGRTEEQCGPLMQAFAERLTATYGFEKAPVVLLRGEPFSSNAADLA